MSIKKWVTGLVVLLSTVIVVTTIGSLGVIAESDVGTDPNDRVNALEVELTDDNFNPKDITIPSGTTTTLLLKNIGVKEHTFTVKKLGIDAKVQPGKEITISIKPEQPGTYDLICRYHFQEGMVGKVIVK